MIFYFSVLTGISGRDSIANLAVILELFIAFFIGSDYIYKLLSYRTVSNKILTDLNKIASCNRFVEDLFDSRPLAHRVSLKI